MGGASLQCPDCPEWFLSKHQLRQHYKDTHPQPPEVLNQKDFERHDWPPGTTYIGRGSPFGNGYVVGRHGERGECIALFITEKQKDPEFIALVKRRLKGRHLMCHCRPRPCHGDWLFEVANTDLLAVEQDASGAWRFRLTPSNIPLQHQPTT